MAGLSVNSGRVITFPASLLLVASLSSASLAQADIPCTEWCEKAVFGLG